MDIPLDLQHAARSICRWMAENNVVNWRLDHLASRDELERVEKELTELRAFKAACEKQEAVAMVDEDGIIIVTAYTYKPGDVFYIKPDPEAAQLRVKAEEMESAFVQCSTVLDGAERWIEELEQKVELQQRKDELLYHGVTHASALVRIAELESENEILKGEIEYWKTRYQMSL